jgi:hypothetical protein
MIFVIKSSSKCYWKFSNNIKLIEEIYISEKNYIKNYYFKIDVFYFNQFLRYFSNQNF